jgi:hypothetical protein
MTKFAASTAADRMVSAVLLCPIIVIFSIPMTIGFGLEVFDKLGEVPFALALSAPLAVVLLRLLSPLSLARYLAALLHPRLPRSGELNYAPRSIS